MLVSSVSGPFACDIDDAQSGGVWFANVLATSWN